MLLPLILPVLGLLVALGPLLQLLVRVLLNGWTRVLCLKERLLPPATLNDSKWGTHHYVQLPGLKMHYVENGNKDKPLMVFLHGFPEFWFSYRYQLQYFAKDYWCVAPDNRGYGDTEKPSPVSSYSVDHLVDDIYHLVKALGRDRCVLVGHDWGGAIGYGVCHKYPKLVSHYVALNIPHPQAFFLQLKTGWAQKLKSWYMLFFQCPSIPEMFLRSEDLKIFEDIFRKDLSTPASDDVIESYKFAFRDVKSFTAPLNYYRCALRYPDRPPKQGKLKVPVLSIFGTGDKYLTVESAKNGKLFVEDFEDRYLDGVSHWVQVEAPQKVNKIIEEYLISRGVK